MQNNTLFGLKIYTENIDQLITDINNAADKIHIISGNAEVLKYPLNNRTIFQQFYAETNIIIPDGISVYYPIKLKNKNCHKIPGIELMEKLLIEFQNTGKSVYFLGAKEKIVKKMISIFLTRYPALKITGYHNGYFDKSDCQNIILEIKSLQPYALFVALGTPAQENFIFRYMNELSCTLFMGVGGSFDVFSETIKRAPKWMRNLGIEWVYRIIHDPSKLVRIWNNIIFTITAFMKG
jgi:N-acetylglucosaminyldiphosphoundecaprenol N-acetyl-beta-D-mannosaminyltransferase